MKEEHEQTDSNGQQKSEDRTDKKRFVAIDAKSDKMYFSDHIEEIWAEIRFR